MRERITTEVLSWIDFREEFEHRYYSKQYRRKKEQKFIALCHENMTVLEYRRQFQDLSTFAPALVSTEQHRIDRLKDEFKQELKVQSPFGQEQYGS